MRKVPNDYRAELPDGSGGEAECRGAVGERLVGRSSRRLRRKHRWPLSVGLLAMLFTGLCVSSALGQSSEGSAEVSPLRRTVAREGARVAADMAAERPAEFEGALAAPQTTEDLRNWERLRGVKVGTRLVVSRLASSDLKVRMEAVAADTLQVRAAHDNVISLRRNEVLAVYQDHRYTTKQWVGIGALTGAAAGFVMGAIADSQNSSELSGLGIRLFPVVGAIYGPLGGLFVAGIANRNPPRLIYRVPLPTEITASSVGTEPAVRLSTLPSNFVWSRRGHRAGIASPSRAAQTNR